MNTRIAQFDGIGGPSIDITAPQAIEVLIRADGGVLWVNVDGICRLRICQIKEITLNDMRGIPSELPRPASEGDPD